MANNMFKLKIDPNTGVFGFCCKSHYLLVEPWQPFMWFLVMADFQNGQQHDIW